MKLPSFFKFRRNRDWAIDKLTKELDRLSGVEHDAEQLREHNAVLNRMLYSLTAEYDKLRFELEVMQVKHDAADLVISSMKNQIEVAKRCLSQFETVLGDENTDRR